jgi:hypothetical protein
MEPMQFWSKLVVKPNDIRTRLMEAGGIVMLVCWPLRAIMARMGHSEDFTLVGVLAGFTLVLIGLTLKKDKIRPTRVMDIDIIITSREIRIGKQTFRIDQVEYLDFLVNSYQGMPGPSVRWRRIVLDGMDNKLYFTADGKKHAYGFFLEDRMAMQRLGMLFREFYQERVFFRERNRGGRTFLFERVMDRNGFEEAKSREGYV